MIAIQTNTRLPFSCPQYGLTITVIKIAIQTSTRLPLFLPTLGTLSLLLLGLPFKQIPDCPFSCPQYVRYHCCYYDCHPNKYQTAPFSAHNMDVTIVVIIIAIQTSTRLPLFLPTIWTLSLLLLGLPSKQIPDCPFSCPQNGRYHCCHCMIC